VVVGRWTSSGCIGEEVGGRKGVTILLDTIYTALLIYIYVKGRRESDS